MCAVPPYPLLAQGPASRPRPGPLFAGEAVAFVVAESVALAREAAELFDVRYEPLPAVVETGRAPNLGSRQSLPRLGVGRGRRGRRHLPRGGPAAAINAVIDALAPLGVRAIDMPATAEAVWRAIRGPA